MSGDTIIVQDQTSIVTVIESTSQVDVSTPGPQGVQGPTILPLPFYIPGGIPPGVRIPCFISPLAGTLSAMRGVCASGSGATYRMVLNGTALTTSAPTGTSVVQTTLSIAIAVGDQLQLEVVSAGTGHDLSVTGVITV